jgi:hypothetical protein
MTRLSLYYTSLSKERKRRVLAEIGRYLHEHDVSVCVPVALREVVSTPPYEGHYLATLGVP